MAIGPSVGAFFDLAPDPCWVLDAEGSLIKKNQRCELIFDEQEVRPLEQIQYLDEGVSALELFDMGDNPEKEFSFSKLGWKNLCERIQNLNEPVHSVKVKNSFIRKSPKEVIWGRLHIVPELVDGSALYWHFCFRLNDLNTKIIDRLKTRTSYQINRAKMSYLSEMANGVAHEVNNPLVMISGYTERLEMMLERDALDHDKIRDNVNRQRTAIKRIAKIVKDLKTFSKDFLESPFETLPVEDLLNDTLRFCKARFRNHRIAIETITPQSEVLVECQPGQLMQALLSLLNNAFDATFATDHPWVKIEVQDTLSRITISITDSGSGIEQKIVDRILEPFYTTKEVGEGIGLGLSIALGIIRNHNGDLKVDVDCPNTRFVISLPKRQPVDQVPEDPIEPETKKIA